MPRHVKLPRGDIHDMGAVGAGLLGAARSLPVMGNRHGIYNLTDSERYCREVTRREARNFYWGFVALPRSKRVAIYALYSFARQVDDDVDLTANAVDEPEHPGRDRFQAHRDRLTRCYAGDADDPVMRVLANIVPRYGIPQEELEALIRGVDMDLVVTRYQTFGELRGYCLLVASTIGRMCVRIFGFTDPVALAYADDLGVALQLTNILRDVREDLDLGRVYLPQEDLRRFGISEQDLVAGCGSDWEKLVHFEIERAERFFDSGLRVTEFIPWRARACVLTMAGMYHAIVEQIAHDPYLPLERRASLGKRDKLSVMLKSWLQAM